MHRGRINDSRAEVEDGVGRMMGGEEEEGKSRGAEKVRFRPCRKSGLRPTDSHSN